jgi:hypothetical protein
MRLTVKCRIMGASEMIFIPFLIDFFVDTRCQSRSNIIHVIIGVDFSGNSKSEKFQLWVAVFACYRIAVGQESSNLDTSYSSFQVGFNGQGLRRELFPCDVRQKPEGIYKYCMTAEGLLYRNAVLFQFFTKILNLAKRIAR